MEEITKKLKMVLFLNSIAAFIFMFLYLIIPELYFTLVDGLVFDPYYWRAFGATLLVLGIFGMRAAINGQQEQAKFMLEIAISWLILILCLNMWELFVLPISPTYRITTWLNSIILVVLILINLYVYVREKKGKS